MLKGKKVRKKPFPVASDYLEITKELINKHQSVTLCIDIMNINCLAYLTTVSRKILYRTTKNLINNNVQA